MPRADQSGLGTTAYTLYQNLEGISILMVDRPAYYQVIGGNREMKLPQYYAAGSIAAIVISMVESPVDLFKIKLQMKNSPYKGLADCAQKIFGGYGIVGVYQGFGATLMRNIPCFGAYFFTFETITLALTKKGEKPSLPICFIAGASAGAAYWGPFYPLEAIKSRMQADHVDPAKRMYSGIINCAKTMAAEGWGAFYRGLTPSLVRGIPVNGAIFTGFTATQRALNS